MLRDGNRVERGQAGQPGEDINGAEKGKIYFGKNFIGAGQVVGFGETGLSPQKLAIML